MTEPGSGWPTISSASRAHSISLVEIDAGLDAHLLAHEDEVLGADVARGALVTGERAAAEPRDARVEHVHAHFERRVRVRDAHAARVVEMQD